ncbi:MAG TPA: hypothetical protein VJT08_07520 [Terriglobales bacterium]|nr:hypothetical protein [Terriglobales bacterium]
MSVRKALREKLKLGKRVHRRFASAAALSRYSLNDADDPVKELQSGALAVRRTHVAADRERGWRRPYNVMAADEERNSWTPGAQV